MPFVTFRFLLCLAFPGMILSLMKRKQFRIIHIIFILLFLIIIMFFIVSRFRLLIIPPLLIYSGLYLTAIYHWWRQRHITPIIAMMVLTSLIYIWNQPVPSCFLRPTEYFLILKHCNETGQDPIPVLEEAFNRYDKEIERANNQFYRALAHYNKANLAFTGRPNFNDIVLEHANKALEIGGEHFPKHDTIIYMLNEIQPK